MAGNLKDVYYFPHDSNAKRDPKMLMLRHQLGAEGYGLYWMLVEDLREQDSYCLPYALLPALAKEYDTTPSKLEAVIKGYGLFVVEDDKIFYSQSLINRMEMWEQTKQLKRLKAAKAAEARWQKALGAAQVSDANVMHEQCTSNAQVMHEHSTSNADAMQSNAMKRKEKKREEKKGKEKKHIYACVDKISSYFSFSEITDFSKYREANQFATLLDTNNRLDDFLSQFDAYVAYKEKTGEKRHRFASFLGTPEKHYMDGGWNAANWIDELLRIGAAQSVSVQSRIEDAFKHV